MAFTFTPARDAEPPEQGKRQRRLGVEDDPCMDGWTSATNAALREASLSYWAFGLLRCRVAVLG